MAKASKPPPSRAPAQRTPAIVAIEQMAKLASSGASAARMVTAVEQVLADWGAEGLDAGDLRERIEQLQADIDAGREAAQDYVGEAETEGQRKAAEGQVAALTAVRDRLAAAIEGR